MSDDAIRDATGRGWDEWCDIIDDWPEHTQGHTAIAARVLAEHDITGWWAQAVTVSYERIRSRPTTKALRVAIGPGVALFDIQPQKSGKVKVTVAHERLPDSEALEAWKFYWGEWLDALE